MSVDKLGDNLENLFLNNGYSAQQVRQSDGSLVIKASYGNAFVGQATTLVQITGDQNQFWYMVKLKGKWAAEFEGGFIGAKRQDKLNEFVYNTHQTVAQWTGAQIVQHYQQEG